MSLKTDNGCLGEIMGVDHRILARIPPTAQRKDMQSLISLFLHCQPAETGEWHGEASSKSLFRFPFNGKSFVDIFAVEVD